MIKPLRMLTVGACLAFALPLARADDLAVTAQLQPGGYSYPTQGRVEYVLGCMDDNGHEFANIYKCSCVIDKMAAVLPYDEFVDQSTFSKYASLGGEGGSEFRVDHAKAQTKKFRSLQTDAYRSCGLGHDKTASAR
ncbi:hypothetical protein [Burkholderia anthina]|uniref:Uncharacterized protein n=1 Tax=Burkholderia anthina TaxID=179879 RepID=A0A6P2G5S9_9BURK|nr:hypothetical protein [Burkholderia anthina]MBM2769256.1 hypothetical protein [Burkholderia anthina]VVU48927.1 hypothetical protein BAN20980_01626 [Burkholderia anthina]